MYAMCFALGTVNCSDTFPTKYTTKDQLSRIKIVHANKLCVTGFFTFIGTFMKILEVGAAGESMIKPVALGFQMSVSITHQKWDQSRLVKK